MATTRIMPMHLNKGKTILQSISARTDYAMNPDKTDGGEYINAYLCNKETVDMDFLLTKQEYESITGRAAKQGRDVIAYQIRQAFYPGEITPELANRVGYELAMQFTKGEHQFIVATHVDKAHVHNHIIFNSTTVDCTHKFNNYKGSAEVLRSISDQLCLKHNLSIIEEPAPKGKEYIEWKAEKSGTSWKAQLRKTIDELLPQCSSFATFLQRMEQAGYEIKHGKYIAFRAPGQERFTRVKSLGAAYCEEALATRIGVKQKTVRAKPIDERQHSVAFLIDIKKKLAEGKGASYEHWAKKFNLKAMSQALMFFERHDFTSIAELETKVDALSDSFDTAKQSLMQTEARMREIQELRKAISDYGRTREVYARYRQDRTPEEFYEVHRAEIEIHKAAKRTFDRLGLGKKLPSLKQLNIEYADLSKAKAKQYEIYRTAKQDMQEHSAVADNLKHMLRADEPKKHRGLDR